MSDSTSKPRRGRPPKAPGERRTEKHGVKVYLTTAQRRKLTWLRGATSASSYFAALVDRLAEEQGYTDEGE